MARLSCFFYMSVLSVMTVDFSLASLAGAHNVTSPDEAAFAGNHFGSCVCQQDCSDTRTDHNSSAIYQLISVLSSTQTSQNTLLTRVVGQLEDRIGQQQNASAQETASLLQSVTSSLENKMAAYGAVLEEFRQIMDSHRQQMARLQTAIDELKPPANYREEYPVFHVADVNGSQITLADARSLCNSLEAKLATVQQLEIAWHQGLDVCRCGWLDDGSARAPIRWPRATCGATAPGIRVCASPGSNPAQLYDGFCVAGVDTFK